LARSHGDGRRLAEGHARYVAVALETGSLSEAGRREAERATAVLDFSRKLSVAEGMDEVVDGIVELSARTLDSPRASVWFQESSGDAMRVRATHGYSESEQERLARMQFNCEQAELFMSGEEPFVFTNHRFEEIAGKDEEGKARPFAVAPLSLDGGRRACIAVSPGDG